VRHSPEGLIRLPYLLQCEGNFVFLPYSGPGLILCPVERGKSEKKPCMYPMFSQVLLVVAHIFEAYYVKYSGNSLTVKACCLSSRTSNTLFIYIRNVIRFQTYISLRLSPMGFHDRMAKDRMVKSFFRSQPKSAKFHAVVFSEMPNRRNLPLIQIKQVPDNL
jgi:hypothetical protein